MSKPLLLFIDFGKVVIWRMGPGPTWVGPAPGCGHPTGRAFATTSTGPRPGRTTAFAARLNHIFEVTVLLKNKGGRGSWRGNALPGTAAALDAPSGTWQGTHRHPGGVERAFG